MIGLVMKTSLLIFTLLTVLTGCGWFQEFRLVEAAHTGNVDWTIKLLKNGVDVNERNASGSALTHAVGNGNFKIVSILLEAGADINVASDGGMTALMWASLKGYTDIVATMLLQTGADINVRSWNGNTALMWAGYKGHKEIVLMLLDAGADISIHDRDGFTALELATISGHAEIVSLLKEASEI